MNLLRIHSNLVLTLDDGTVFSTSKCDDEFQKKVMECLKNDDRDGIIALFEPDYAEATLLTQGLSKSKIITVEGESAYIKSISELTIPQDFAKRILEAESKNDEDKLTAYLNFWTLLSLNPDSRVRNNLFWFLNRWGMTISKSGLIVAYRNADIKQEGVQFNQELTRFVSQQYMNTKYNNPSQLNDMWVVMVDDKMTVCAEWYLDTVTAPEDRIVVGKLVELYDTLCNDNSDLSTVYTDHHSHTFEIRLGHVVSMDRKKVDSDQHHTCSTGLHVGAKGWLEKNYYGSIGMKVLVNPADVVAVPPEDNYGKMRTCAYYPISIIEYNENGHIKDDGIESGFEDDFINKICYTGEVNNEDNDNYKLTIPCIAEINRETVYANLKKLAYTAKESRKI